MENVIRCKPRKWNEYDISVERNLRGILIMIRDGAFVCYQNLFMLFEEDPIEYVISQAISDADICEDKDIQKITECLYEGIREIELENYTINVIGA